MNLAEMLTQHTDTYTAGMAEGKRIGARQFRNQVRDDANAFLAAHPELDNATAHDLLYTLGLASLPPDECEAAKERA